MFLDSIRAGLAQARRQARLQARRKWFDQNFLCIVFAVCGGIVLEVLVNVFVSHPPQFVRTYLLPLSLVAGYVTIFLSRLLQSPLSPQQRGSRWRFIAALTAIALIGEGVSVGIPESWQLVRHRLVWYKERRSIPIRDILMGFVRWRGRPMGNG
jgi:hypothetical protein